MRFSFQTSAAAVLAACLMAGFVLVGCGSTGGPSSLFFTSGLFPLTVGSSGGTPPAPTEPPPDEDGGGGDGGGDAQTICLTFRNDANADAGVVLYMSTSLTITFQNLVTLNNLEPLPETDEGCIDEQDRTADPVASPTILEGLFLNYQLNCDQVGSFAVSARQTDAPIITPDDTAGPFRQGIDFFCGDTLVIEITDTDLDDEFEIGF